MIPFTTSRTLKRILSTLKSFFHPSRAHATRTPIAGGRHAQPYLERFMSLEDLRRHFGDAFPLRLTKILARDILSALRENEKRGFVHGNINQNSIVMSVHDLQWISTRFRDEDSDDEDEMNDSFSSRSSAENVPLVFRLAFVDHSPHISLSVRSPEMIIEAPCNTSTDIWSLGCVLYWLLTGEMLFDPAFQCADLGLTPDESHLIQVVEMLGAFPEELVRRGSQSGKWFRKDGTLHVETTLYPVTLNDALRQHWSIASFDVDQTVEFLSRMITLLPSNRANVRELMRHSWLS